jgi:hypothetical protein
MEWRDCSSTLSLSLSLSLCIYIYIYVCVCMYVCVYLYIVVGAWIRSMFHGYIVCRLPFWVPETFRSMLQSGMEMIGQHLDTRYVSGLSWYIVSIFGLQGLVLDKKEASMDRGSEWQLGSSSEIQTKMLLKQEIQWWKTIEYHCET